jgi:hypothetical protein
MRANEWGKHIKVLVISNLNENDAPDGLRELGIEGYVVKANLTDDALDRMVDQILKPSGQKEDVSLETPGSESFPKTDQPFHQGTPPVQPPTPQT